jgi:murein L,D-transpeptidase YcbB/YkuD
MKVVVGTPEQQTPAMAALIRYAVFNPNWNVPPDLTRDTYAPRIRADRAVLRSLQMDVWSDYTPQAQMLDPASVDWSSVARGGKAVWLRQRPGPQNAMGAVKFMLPNVLGIYLHDTPNRELFAREPRTFSAGCIRVEDYKRFARWLYGRDSVGPTSAKPEQRIDLPTPVPVYITYLTAAPLGGGVESRADVYRRDPAVLAQLYPVAAPATPVDAGGPPDVTLRGLPISGLR